MSDSQNLFSTQLHKLMTLIIRNILANEGNFDQVSLPNLTEFITVVTARILSQNFVPISTLEDVYP